MLKTDPFFMNSYFNVRIHLVLFPILRLNQIELLRLLLDVASFTIANTACCKFYEAPKFFEQFQPCQ